MEFSVTDSICNKCVGEESCSKYCILHAAKALINFLTRVDITETHIGDYESTERNGRKDLVCYGHKLWEVGQPAHILGDIKIVLDSEPKFSGQFGLSTTALLNKYCKQHNVCKQDIERLHSMVRSITKNKIIVLPLKPHMECMIDINKSMELAGTDKAKPKAKTTGETTGKSETGTGTETGTASGTSESSESKKSKTHDRYEQAFVHYISWKINHDTHKIDCIIAFKVGSKSSEKTYRYSLSEYMQSFRMNSDSATTAMDKKLISMTDYGIIKPIEITDGKSTIAVDGSFVYDVQSSMIRVIGHWTDSGDLKINNGEKSKLLKKLLDNKTVIKNHRRYIAPYMLYPSNTVNVRTKD